MNTGLGYNPYQRRARKRLPEQRFRKKYRRGEGYDWLYPSLLVEFYMFGKYCWEGCWNGKREDPMQETNQQAILD